MVVHTFGEYLDFHPHLHALVAYGLFQRGGWFHVLPASGIRPLEELFRARTHRKARGASISSPVIPFPTIP